MIKYRIEGIEEAVKKLGIENLIDRQKMDAVVEDATRPLVAKIKENYLSKGHKITGNLINSIQAFRRRKKDNWFTYYVGPKYAGRNNLEMGGNHAHFLEYGVPFSSYAVKGQGKSIRGRKYGKFVQKTGFRINPTGVLRLSKDQMEASIIKQLGEGFTKVIIDKANK
jgi:hypothetical protein